GAVLLRLLVVSAGGQQDVAAGHVPPCRPGGQVAGGAGRDQGLDVPDVAAQGPLPQVRLNPPVAGLVQPGDPSARAGVAAIQQYDDVGTAAGHVLNQHRQLLVGQVPTARLPAVVADEGLVEVVRLDVPELPGGLLLRAVPAVTEQGD